MIRSVDYGETSKILTVFSYEAGIISVMARGVKSAKSKKINLASPFTEAIFELNKSKDFFYLKDGEILEDNLKLRENINKIYLCQLFFDIIERTSMKDTAIAEVYLLLAKSMRYLKTEVNFLKVTNMFLIKYISMIGYKPVLSHCVSCKKRTFKSVYFSYEMGGILCEECKKINNIELNYKEYSYLCHILVEVFEKIAIINEDIDEKKIFRILIDFIRYNTDIAMPQAYKSFVKLVGID